MQYMRRGFVRTFLAAAAVFAIGGPVAAQTPVTPAAGTDNPAKVEVVEFFSYGCPHCNDFNPLITAWAAKLPADVVFKKVPITFGRAAWANIAKLYYALEITGDLARLDGDVFKAIHSERVALMDDKVMAEWVAKKGVDPKKFADAYNSFGVMSKVKRGDQLAAAYKIQGVPAIGVDGKYLVGDKSHQELLSITDQLIGKLRTEKSGKK